MGRGMTNEKADERTCLRSDDGAALAMDVADGYRNRHDRLVCEWLGRWNDAWPSRFLRRRGLVAP